MPTVSIIIPTIGRKDSLYDCLESIWSQTYQDYEIIKVTEEGELAKLRNQGASKARGKYLVFIDDDVICSRNWLEAIVKVFETKDISGVSGPSFTTNSFRNNRDIFKWPIITWLYSQLFLGRQASLPGHITKSGTWTLGATKEGCAYEGEVQYLEACNMAFKKETFLAHGGFDERYRGIGDWSEPDLSFRIRQAGHKLWFSRDAVLEHRPSKSGAFKKRSSDSGNRLANYELFASRWIAPCWQHSLYKWFLRTYYEIKTRK